MGKEGIGGDEGRRDRGLPHHLHKQPLRAVCGFLHRRVVIQLVVEVLLRGGWRICYRLLLGALNLVGHVVVLYIGIVLGGHVLSDCFLPLIVDAVVRAGNTGLGDQTTAMLRALAYSGWQ